TPYAETSPGSGFINLADYYPYQPQSNTKSAQSMQGNPGEMNWLTHVDFSRYPSLVSTAKEQAALVGGSNHLTIAKQMERFFTESTEYTYTLNFRDVQWNPDLDAVEDFMRNIRKGHCELYASALTIMLRSQGIPARYVIGLYGGELNELGDFYIVRQGLAHAWVEVYIRPEDCSPDMVANKQIAERGAWVRLDPTPGDSLSQRYYRGSFALDYARTVWEDYVLGLDAQRQDDWAESTGSMLFGLFDLSSWSESAQRTMNSIQGTPSWQLIIIGLLLVAAAGGIAAAVRRLRGKARGASSTLSPWRKWIGAALSVIAPEIGGWILTDRHTAKVGFYRRVLAALRKVGLERDSGETIRELSQRAEAVMSTNGVGPAAIEHLNKLTVMFHEVRFGGVAMTAEQRQDVERRVAELERILQSLPPRVVPT
ncbi:MAG TPA: transglutaminase domain-containing protein, partial [Pirellulaceae bacterium]|nr:transglutaminase domain-containing protein [Pirellulaceae bacterium]